MGETWGIILIICKLIKWYWWENGEGKIYIIRKCWTSMTTVTHLTMPGTLLDTSVLINEGATIYQISYHAPDSITAALSVLSPVLGEGKCPSIRQWEEEAQYLALQPGCLGLSLSCAAPCLDSDGKVAESPCLCFLICKIGMIIVFDHEDAVRRKRSNPYTFWALPTMY